MTQHETHAWNQINKQNARHERKHQAHLTIHANIQTDVFYMAAKHLIFSYLPPLDAYISSPFRIPSPLNLPFVCNILQFLDRLLNFGLENHQCVASLHCLKIRCVRKLQPCRGDADHLAWKAVHLHVAVFLLVWTLHAPTRCNERILSFELQLWH